jgi:hypothetical protein
VKTGWELDEDWMPGEWFKAFGRCREQWSHFAIM